MKQATAPLIARFLVSLILALIPCPRAGSAAAERPPQRIVSLAPSVTEILYRIDLGDRIAGVTEFCDFPAAARQKPRIGGFANPSAERIVALRPDLVIVQPNVGNRATVETVQRLGIAVLVVEARDFEGLFATIRAIGQATGRNPQAAALAAALRDEVESLAGLVRDAPRPSVLLAFSRDPYIVAGPASFPGEMIRLAGGHNPGIDSGAGYPRVGIETILGWAPEVILEPAPDGGTDRDLLAAWQRWPSLPAVARGRVHAVPPDLIMRAGPRSPEGLRELIRILHPEALEAQTTAP